MTLPRNNRNYSLPQPITKLTVEQDLKMRLLQDKLAENYHDMQEDVTTLMVALQHQNFVLSNSLTNLVEKWPHPHEEIVFIRPG